MPAVIHAATSANRAHQVVFALNVFLLGPHSRYTESFIKMPKFQ